MLHLGRLSFYLQTLDKAEKAYKGKTLQLITNFRKLRPQKGFITLGPDQDSELLFSEAYQRLSKIEEEISSRLKRIKL